MAFDSYTEGLLLQQQLEYEKASQPPSPKRSRREDDHPPQSGTGWVSGLHQIVQFTQDPIGPSDHGTLLAPISLTSHISLHGLGYASTAHTGRGRARSHEGGVATVATEATT